ncbi:MAG TPA: hypothetical protein VHT51_17720 [Micropepsaceae bacterium]|jgi:hypothetical protein|nr:hypothetical protein [Micropepsaceae bacterium]
MKSATQSFASVSSPYNPGKQILLLITFAIALLALVPLFLTRFLPINDYPFHLGRMVILAQLADPTMGRFYQLGSFLLPNVGMDAVVVPMSELMGPELATRVFVGLTLLFMLLGAMALHWAAHRRLSVWPLLALTVLHNGIFRFGFFNYLFGLGLAFAAAALWLVMRKGLGQLAVAFIACIVLIFCHMEAFGVYALIVGGVELQKAIAAWMRTKSLAPVGGLFYSATPFVLTLVLFVLLSPTAGVIGSGLAYDPGLGTKPIGALYALSSGVLWLDAVTAATVLAACAWLLATGRAVISWPLATACFLVLLAFVALPSSIMGSLYADTRLAPAIAILAMISLDIRADAPKFVPWTIVAVALVLAVFRMGILSSIWVRYDSQIAPIVKALDGIEPGATLFAITSEQYPRLIANTPERVAAWNPPVKHVASYAVLHGPVFVPMTFADPTKQPLIVSNVYQQVKDFQGENPTLVTNQKALTAFLATLQAHLDSSDWPHIDLPYVLVMGRQNLEPMELPATLIRVAQGDKFVLLRFSKRQEKNAQ